MYIAFYVLNELLSPWNLSVFMFLVYNLARVHDDSNVWLRGELLSDWVRRLYHSETPTTHPLQPHTQPHPHSLSPPSKCCRFFDARKSYWSIFRLVGFWQIFLWRKSYRADFLFAKKFDVEHSVDRAECSTSNIYSGLNVWYRTFVLDRIFDIEHSFRTECSI